MFLIIETATVRGLIALCEEDQVLAEQELLLGLANSRSLEPAMEALFKKVGKKPKDLQFVACGTGPGSYTGLRVGAASAKAVAIGCNIPLVGISSLKGFCPPEDYQGDYRVCVDARIGGIYVLEDGIEKLLPAEKLQNLACVVTPQWEPLKQRISAEKVFERGPSAKALMHEAKEKFNKKQYSSDGTLELQYLRLTQAEIEKLPNKQHFE